MMKRKLLIHGVTTLETPLHVATWAEQYRLNDSGHIVHGTGKTPGTSPITRTTREMYLLSHQLMEAPAEESSAKTRIVLPIFPSNDFRGRIRSKAAELVEKQLLANNEKISIGAYNGINCGAAYGKPDSLSASMAEMKAVAAHPFMGLFGGGPRLHQSRFDTFDWRAITKVIVNEGLIPEPFEAYAIDADYAKMTSVVKIIRRDKALQMDDKFASGIVVDYLDAINDYQDSVSSAAKSRKSDDGGGEKNYGLRSMAGFEVVNSGTPFYFKTQVAETATDAQIGLLLSALIELAKDQRVGGLVSKGLGRFRMNAYINIDSTDEEAFDANGITMPSIERYLSAWKKASESITGADIERFFKEGVMAA